MLKEKSIIPQANKFLALSLIMTMVGALVYPIFLMNSALMIPPKVWRFIALIPSGFLVFFAIKFLREGNTGMIIFFAVLFLFSLLVSSGLGNLFDDE